MKVTTCQVFQAGFQSILLMGLPESPALNNLKEVWFPTFFCHNIQDDDIYMGNTPQGTAHTYAQFPAYELSSALPRPPGEANRNKSECGGFIMG